MLIRGKNAKEAKEAMKFMPQASAREIYKIVSSAVANAQHNFSLEPDALTISNVTIDGGPALKRYRPRARGRVSNIKRKTSHITVIVSGDIKTKKVAAPKPKSESKLQTTGRVTREKQEPTVESVGKETEDHKIEVERPASTEVVSGRPEFVKKEPAFTDVTSDKQETPKFNIKDKIFRRKTG